MVRSLVGRHGSLLAPTPRPFLLPGEGAAPSRPLSIAPSTRGGAAGSSGLYASPVRPAVISSSSASFRCPRASSSSARPVSSSQNSSSSISTRLMSTLRCEPKSPASRAFAHVLLQVLVLATAVGEPADHGPEGGAHGGHERKPHSSVASDATEMGDGRRLWQSLKSRRGRATRRSGSGSKKNRRREVRKPGVKGPRRSPPAPPGGMCRRVERTYPLCASRRAFVNHPASMLNIRRSSRV
jgi:hypothetical protein